jgi:hypothetical protein
MGKFLVFLPVLLVIFMVYFLLYYTLNNKTEASTISGQLSEGLKTKLSIRQIDSLTSVENFSFTLVNFKIDSAHLISSGKK